MCALRDPAAPLTAPDFLLSRAHGSVRTQGTLGTFTDPWAAVAALKADRVPMVVGALPFERAAQAALTVPEHIVRDDGPLEPHSYYRYGPGATLNARVKNYDPAQDKHAEIVAAAVATIRNTSLKKVVIARAIDIAFDSPVDPLLVAAKLIDKSYHRDGFITDLTPAGDSFTGHTLVGASPEVLIKRQGSTVSAYPLAGSAPRSTDLAIDRAHAQQLFESSKNQEEHSYVVDHLRTLLTPLCASLSIPKTPELTKTNEMWHLATPIVGTLKDQSINALELALTVHPTPAICGTPTDAAEALIMEAESPRRFYAGAVGWSDSSGDGEYMVAIRCAEISGDGLTARAWAGGGIVADSNPTEEYEETSAKLRTIMRALGQ